MKKFLILLVVVFSFSSIYSFGANASAQTKSFLLDKSKIYKIAYYSYSKNNKSIDYSTFYYKKSWKSWTTKEGGELWEHQDKSKYTWGGGYGGGDEISRNAKIGDKVYSYGSASKSYLGKVVSIKATVKTKAGTFKNCTLVQNKKLKYYYAPNNGLVKKTDVKGRTIREVVKITKR
ncbi:hypothetical protein [Rummeliibacillus suwonensis]|uniref:hypothetical protein n=1 Tax=Rummeliibacillus suwonensis TaxID=1306154 RepID=UPI0028A2195E|nr:hypothetical protein [Rummeliibacillus suwonensis]